jgi:hypothetical protein
VATVPAVQAQSYSAFGFRPPADLIVPAFTDEGLSELLATLDGLVAGPTRTPPDQQPVAGPTPPGQLSAADPAVNDALWQFGRRLQTGSLSATQETRVLAHLDGLVQANASLGPAAAGTRRVIQQLTVGKTAPDILGTDLTGRPFKLSD